jgi:hypothetical protein
MGIMFLSYSILIALCIYLIVAVHKKNKKIRKYERMLYAHAIALDK